jgi:anaphase-promoting complex subunit 5
MQNRDRLFYQYALLNLAVLQADFGCYHEAVAAMQETVATARENKDMGCLNFSLSWLYHFGKAHPSIITAADKNNSMLSVEREGLTFLRLKAKESGMWSLWSSSLLSEAKLGLSNGESIALAFENILRSSQLNVTKNMMANVGSQMMLQSSLWSRLGITHLAWSYCEVFLRAHCTSAPFDDTLHFSCRAAYLLAQKGQYKAAHERLTRLDPNALRSLKASQYWLTFRGILQLQHDLHHHNLAGAELLLRQLLQNRGGDTDLSFELDVLHIEYLMALGDLSRALSCVEELASNLQGEGEDVYFHVRLLIMKAYLFARCDRPQKGFSIAVRAATIAWRARLLPCLWEAMGVIANILRSLSEFPAAAEILEAVLPRALECDDAVLSAMLWGYWSDAQMGLAKMVEGRTRKTYLNKALEGVERTFDEYAKVEDHKAMREYTAKKAVILQALGEVGLAGDAAGKYMELLRTERESFTA